MQQTLNFTDEDLFATVARVSQVKVQVEQGLTARKLKIQYSKVKNVPYDCAVIILNDQILSGADKVEQGNSDKLQIKDVRTMYKELKSHLQKGTDLREQVKNKNEFQRKLEQDLELAQEKIRQQEGDINNYQNNLNDLGRQKLLLEQELEYTKTQFNDAYGSLQQQFNQSQKQNENLNSQIGEMQQVINQYQQQNLEANQTIDQYNQYLNNINQECLQSFRQQYQPGLFIFYQNEFEKFQLEANQAIDQLQKDKHDLEETIVKNKTDSEKKYKKLQTDKQQLESELQDRNEIIDKDKKNITRLQQENNALKGKLKQAEEDLDKQLEAQGQTEEQKQQKLNDQIRQLQKKNTDLEGERFRLTQIEQEYQKLQILFKQKSDEHKKLQDESEKNLNSLNEQFLKLQTDLKNSEKIRTQAELKLDATGKQSQLQIQTTQQQLEEQNAQNKALKADITKLTEQIQILTKQAKDLQVKLADAEDQIKASDKRTQESNQQISELKSQKIDLENKKYSLEQQIVSLNRDLENSKRDFEALKQVSDKTIHSQQIEIEQYQNQNDLLQEKITWLIPKLPKNQHKPNILSLVETLRNQLPVLEHFVMNESGSFDDSDFVVYKINPVENLLKEVWQGKLLQDQKILELQQLGEITAKRSINATTENSDYFRGFMLKVTHGLGELIDKLHVIRENKNGEPNFPTGEAAVVTAHNQFLAEYILQQFNIFLLSKGRQQSDLKFPATYIFQKKGEQKFYLTEEIQEGPLEKYLGGQLPIRNDNDDAKFSNALALYSYYKSGKSMMLSNLQTLNRVYHDTIVCTKIGQLTNYDQGFAEINLITNELGGKGEEFIDPFIVREDEVNI
ncbi:hypothetical protein pb186bvf_006537 [Paramecium bursaria]